MSARRHGFSRHTGAGLRLIFVLASLAPSMAHAAGVAPACGGSFSDWLADLHTEARAAGHAPQLIDAFLRNAAPDPKVLQADRAQGVFRQSFLKFSSALISPNRLQNAKRLAIEQAEVFDQIASEYGIDPGILLAFWAFETDFGKVQGNFNTRNALLTLAHDCRRPAIFRPQILAALTLFERGEFDPDLTTGAWAGEIGMVQMLPRDILAHGIDADGDGQVDLKRSAPDALHSAAHKLAALGWQSGAPWLQEVRVPQTLDWQLSGLDKPRPVAHWKRLGITPQYGRLPSGQTAALILPQGHQGPAFLAYPNFQTLFAWNQSFIYVTTAAYFATLIAGAPPLTPGTPPAILSTEQMQALQQKLAQRGHDVGKIDGILGAATRAAVQAEQARLGLPADAWPTTELLNRL